MNILHIDSSVTGGNSVSRRLTRSIVHEWQRAHPDAAVTYRDLAAEAPDHLSSEILGARFAPADQHSAAQREQMRLDEELLEEFLAADLIVLGAPMYNFSVPSQLKAWIDRVLVAGRTFRYTADGPVGLVGGKKVVIASTRGGIYSEADAAKVMDHQEAYLRAALGFIGLTDVSIIRAEGVNMSDRRDRAIASAKDQIHELLGSGA